MVRQKEKKLKKRASSGDDLFLVITWSHPALDHKIVAPLN